MRGQEARGRAREAVPVPSPGAAHNDVHVGAVESHGSAASGCLLPPRTERGIHLCRSHAGKPVNKQSVHPYGPHTFHKCE